MSSIPQYTEPAKPVIPKPDPVVQKPVPSILAPVPATGTAPAPAGSTGLIAGGMAKQNDAANMAAYKPNGPSGAPSQSEIMGNYDQHQAAMDRAKIASGTSQDESFPTTFVGQGTGGPSGRSSEQPWGEGPYQGGSQGSGLIAGAMTKPAPKPNVYNPDNIQAERASVANWNVDDNQLVEKRAANLIKEDSPLMQLARSRAEQQANGRGLLNSSIAVGAGQTAVLDKAIDIGGRDASTFAQSAQFNADSSNKASMFNAGQSNQWNANKLDKDWMGRENVLDRDWKTGEREADQTFRTGEREASQGWQTGESEKDRTWKTGEAQVDRDWRTGEAKEDRAFQGEQKDKDRTLTTTENQKNRDAEVERYQFDAKTQKELKDLSFKYQKELDSDAAFNQQYSQYMDTLKQIDLNPDLDENAKMVMKDQARAGLQSFVKIKDMKLDLNFGGGDGFGGDAPDYTKPSNQTQENFDEAAYMAANPDLAQSGWDRGAWAHYQMYGKNEGRPFTGKESVRSSGGGESINGRKKRIADENADPTTEEKFRESLDPANIFGGNSTRSKNQNTVAKVRDSIFNPLGFKF